MQGEWVENTVESYKYSVLMEKKKYLLISMVGKLRDTKSLRTT